MKSSFLCRLAHQAVVLAIVDAREAAYAHASKVDDPSMAHVEDIFGHPPAIIKFPQMISRLVIPSNCTEEHRHWLDRELPASIVHIVLILVQIVPWPMYKMMSAT